MAYDPMNPGNDDGSGGGAPNGPSTPGQTGRDAFLAWARPVLSRAYQMYLGRDISDAEFASYTGPTASQGTVQQAVDTVRDSPESKTYQTSNPGKWGQPPAATPGGGSTPPTNPGTGTKGDYAAFGKAWGDTKGTTAADLKAFVDAHPEYGAEIFGSKMNKVKIGGKVFKAISATSDPAHAANQWLDITNGEGAPNGGANGLGLTDPSLYAPYEGTFTAPKPIDPFNFPDFVPPEEFHAPTKAQAEQEPGYQFRLEQGEGALQAAGAAKGLARSGGFYKGLIDYGQNFASSEYKNVYDRATNDYKMNFDRLLTTQHTNFDEKKSEYEAHQHQSELEYDHSWKQYLEQADIFYANQKNRYDRLYGNAQLGLNAQ